MLSHHAPAPTGLDPTLARPVWAAEAPDPGAGLAPPPPVAPPAGPLDLPRLVLRRASWVAVLGLVAALVLGLARARYDTGQELDGALSIARTAQQLQAVQQLDDAAALESLQALTGLRHLRLELRDAQDRLLLRSPEPSPPGWMTGLLLQLSGRLAAPPAAVADVVLPVARPRGAAWTAHLIATPQSEQREAMGNLADLLLLLGACSALMLSAMRWNVQRAFRPLAPLLAAIARLEHQDRQPLRALPPMPIRELDAISAALRHLADALQQAEDDRRLLGHKVLTLQEDERQRLARDLHDELGQRLTAMRVDAAWLARRLATEPELRPVLDGLIEQCSRLQQDVRGMLARLRPLGPGADESGDATESAERLKALLDGLVDSWSQARPDAPRCSLRLMRGPAERAGLLRDDQLAAMRLPRELVLVAYRITQEALTNVARHAQAGRAEVLLRFETTSPLTATLYWSVEDDGVGIADVARAFRQGNGLAGLKERVWALGGELGWCAVQSRPPRGLRLEARLPFEWPSAPPWTEEGSTR